MQGKKAVYLVATNEPIEEQLKKFGASIGLAIGDEKIVKYGVTSWGMLFDAAGRYSGKEKLIIAIDEFPYLSRLYLPISSVLQASWDQYISKANVMLILGGSSIGMMKNEVLSYSAPLYGRSSLVFNLKPLNFIDTMKLFPKSTPLHSGKSHML
jgi:AAA+ ATPase superfamily predicted ATPase